MATLTTQGLLANLGNILLQERGKRTGCDRLAWVKNENGFQVLSPGERQKKASLSNVLKATELKLKS